MTFQFGDFYNLTSGFSENVKWFIGILLAIFISVLLFYLARAQKHKIEHLENKNYIDFFFNLIKNLMKLFKVLC